MRVLLTSFGISASLGDDVEFAPQRPTRHRPPDGDAATYVRMPPVDMRSFNALLTPDYATLLLADKLVMDAESFHHLQTGASRRFGQVSETLHALHTDGHVELVDFRSALSSRESTIQKMVELDMRSLDAWVEPLKDSVQAWTEFVHALPYVVPPERIGNPHTVTYHAVGRELHQTQMGVRDMLHAALESSRNRRRREYRDVLRRVLSGYLRHVNSTLVLAREFNVGFHDWSDFLPFYNRKFLSVGQESTDPEERASQLRKLFSVPFPELAIHDPKHFMRVISDRRIHDLRKLASQAAAGEVAFDEEFAKRTLLEVLRIQNESSRWRNIASYVTMPLGLIPWVGAVLEKVAGELAGSEIDRRLQADFRWYYLLSSTVEHA